MILCKKKETTKSIREKSKIDILQELVDQQNKELINYRWAAQNYNELKEKQKELDELIKEHTELCDEARKQVEEYTKLNRELKKTIADCKRYMQEAIELNK